MYIFKLSHVFRDNPLQKMPQVPMMYPSLATGKVIATKWQQLSNEENSGWLGYIGDYILPSYMCQGLNSHYFHIIGDGHQPNSRGLYTHYKDSY